MEELHNKNNGLHHGSFERYPDRPKVVILCAFHYDCPVDDRISGPEYLPVFGGKALYRGNSGSVISMQGDDVGENISEMNPLVNEITVLYWAWKHYAEIGNPDYIGLNHYRRFIDWSYDDLSQKTILAYENVLTKSIFDQYAWCHVSKDLVAFSERLCNGVLSETERDAWNSFLKSYRFYSNNMFVMPKNAFFDYMAFMDKCIGVCMDMLNSSELDPRGRIPYQRRAFSFILERCTGFKILLLGLYGGYSVRKVGRVAVNCE